MTSDKRSETESVRALLVDHKGQSINSLEIPGKAIPALMKKKSIDAYNLNQQAYSGKVSDRNSSMGGHTGSQSQLEARIAIPVTQPQHASYNRMP